MKKVLITGGSRGIGAECVRLFCEKGYDVYFIYEKCAEQADALMRQTGATAIKLDVSDTAAVEDALKRIGGVDILINNAGIASIKPLTDVDRAEWDRILSVNLTGAYNTTKAALSRMLEFKWGRIVNVSSVWGIAGASCEAPYSASKSALIGFTKAMAKELAPSGITVNCCAPGVIDTDMNAALTGDIKAQLCEEIPLGRFGDAREVAKLIFFLASDDASYITGQTIACDGGFAL